jgi:hypothetical protein
VSHVEESSRTHGCSKGGNGVYSRLRKGVTRGHGGPGEARSTESSSSV